MSPSDGSSPSGTSEIFGGVNSLRRSYSAAARQPRQKRRPRRVDLRLGAPQRAPRTPWRSSSSSTTRVPACSAVSPPACTWTRSAGTSTGRALVHGHRAGRRRGRGRPVPDRTGRCQLAGARRGRLGGGGHRRAARQAAPERRPAEPRAGRDRGRLRALRIGAFRPSRRQFPPRPRSLRRRSPSASICPSFRQPHPRRPRA